jgi:hypothetical protein
MQMKRRMGTMKKAVLGFFCALAVMWASPVLATGNYADPEGHFVVDVPDGWKVQHEKGTNFYEITDGSDSFLVSYLPGKRQLEELYDLALSMLRTSLTGGQENGELKQAMETRQGPSQAGTPVKVGGYAGEVSYGGVAVTMYGYAVVLPLGEGGITIVSAMDEDVFRKVSDPAMAMFFSVRESPEGQ